MPGAQLVHTAELPAPVSVLYVPALQVMQVADDAEPVVMLYVPAEQATAEGRAEMTPPRQYEPAEHCVQPVPDAHAYPGAHAVAAICTSSQYSTNVVVE